MSKKTTLSRIAVVMATILAFTAACSPTPVEPPASGGDTAAAVNAPEWCGTKPMIVGYNSGNDSNGWRQITLAILKDYVKVCPNITKVIYTDARGQAQQQISQFDSLIAQGANAIVTIPEAGQALLPSFRKAMANGTSIVPFTQPPGGEPGKDYTVAVVADNVALGYSWGEWMCQALDGKGNIIFEGGVPGNSQSAEEFEGAKKAIAEKCPDVKWLEDEPITTNWQVAMYQQATAGLIAKYGDQIDGIIVDFGEGFVGGVTAFQNAGQKIPAIATNSANELACVLMEEKAPFMFYTSGNAQVKNALEQAVAAYQGTTPPQKALYEQSVVFDTINGPQPECIPGLAGGAAMGEGLSIEELKAILAGK